MDLVHGTMENKTKKWLNNNALLVCGAVTKNSHIHCYIYLYLLTTMCSSSSSSFMTPLYRSGNWGSYSLKNSHKFSLLRSSRGGSPRFSKRDPILTWGDHEIKGGYPLISYQHSPPLDNITLPSTPEFQLGFWNLSRISEGFQAIFLVYIPRPKG